MKKPKNETTDRPSRLQGNDGGRDEFETTAATEQAPAAVRTFDFPPGFRPADYGFTPAQVLEAAIAGHQINKEYCESLGDMSQVDWGQAPDWQCNSAIQGVCHAIANDFPSPEEMHKNWMTVKATDGWVYGEVKDATAKTHPCMVSYDQLPEAQRVKDDLFRNTIMQVLAVDMSQKDRDELNRLAGEVLKQEPAPPAGPSPAEQEARAMASMLMGEAFDS
jgi:hypothetical protein